jgi:hypothetical protein
MEVTLKNNSIAVPQMHMQVLLLLLNNMQPFSSNLEEENLFIGNSLILELVPS